ncbi:HNH endonuclease [Microbacterium saccharophilum]|uniref:HNH endonuclease n=2 Tax=Microbacteriaceae TaxID=85023 RepID=A0A7Z7GEQ8_9MICO|nr:HNH endonuclease [Microbacterium saccharophilum]
MDALLEAVTAAREVWPVGRLEGVEGARLIAVNDALGVARRLLEAAWTQVAAEIARQSRPELGADSLAKANGFRTATALLASTLGTTNGEASRLVQVGDATAPRLLLSGGEAPAKHPHVGAALAAGSIGALAASAIVSMLDRVALRATSDGLEAAERTLVEQAPGLTLDQLSKLIIRAEAHLDPDGVQPREEELRAQRFLRVQEDRSGMLHLTGAFDPEHGAAIMVAIDAIVGAELGAQRDADASSDVDAPRRSVAMMRADALVKICEHLLGCDRRDTPLRGATVVVRMTLDDLRSGTGHATIDGLAAPVSISTARRMAADAGIIPVVLGGDSEILDWGRQRRLFTRAQKLALTERDGGCAMCGVPPGHTKVHHIRWWARDRGPTDLANGVLLCESCHHRIHDNGWDIRIDGKGVDARVWFIPPAHIDPQQTPRLGGRRRYDYLAA